MKFIKVTMVMLALLGLNSCQKLEELEKNPNVPASAPASLILNGLLNDMYTERPWSKEMRHNQFYAINYNYYGNNEYDWTSTDLKYLQLKNVVKMEEEAKKATGKDLNPYTALAKFLKAYYFNWMTTRVGDLPLTEALQGVGNTTPKYNSQKEVYIQILKWLDEANTELAGLISAGDRSLQGDIYLGNDLIKWQKVVNTFKVRVLVSLSKKDTDAELAVKKQFSDILSNPSKFPILGSMGDNLEYKYNSTFNKYPINPDNFGFDATRQNMAATHINLLVSLRDPRLFVVAEPAEAKIKAGLKASDFEAYVGASSAESLDDMSTKILKGEYSLINRKRYYSNYTAENCLIVAYPELMFNLAEGINRGWAEGDANDFYTKGIKASMSFYGINQTDEYLNQAIVKYAGNNANGLTQILTQKYLAFFQNSGYEAFFQYRRTGVPAFAQGGAGTGNSGKIPRRWIYPSSERIYNKVNYETAINGQFAGKDGVNEDLWAIK